MIHVVFHYLKVVKTLKLLSCGKVFDFVFLRIIGFLVINGFVRSIDCDGGKLIINGVYIPYRSRRELASDTELLLKIMGLPLKFKVIRRSIYQVIIDYRCFDPRNKVIVDIGAYIGDPALYFAYKGAKLVIAVEPHPEAYFEMLKNIKLNGHGGRIIPINAAISSRHGCVDARGSVITALTQYYTPSTKANDCIIKAITLGDLIKAFNLTKGTALKMDYEGCELDVILNDCEHVRLFRELVFEYHSYAVNKPVSDLLSMLSTDYKCEMRGNNKQGIMHCVRE
jgi:FkbM family methyltransferase